MNVEELISFLQRHITLNPGDAKTPIRDINTHAEIVGMSIGSFGIALTTDHVEFKVDDNSTWEYFEELFQKADIEVLNHYQIPNEYWPSMRLKAKSPWWLVHTNIGMIKIGWRKRVISIDWSDTLLRCIVTTDEVTRDLTMVHAWTKDKALEYLTTLSSNIPPKTDIKDFALNGLKKIHEEHAKLVGDYLAYIDKSILNK